MTESPLSFQVVVVGAGPAGLAAACAAAESGRRTALFDETPWRGGQIWRGPEAPRKIPEAARWLDRFRRSGATLFDNCAALGPAGRGMLLAEQTGMPRLIQWERLILATGARELFLPFPGWTLPGNFGPGGLQSLAKHGWPVREKRIVVAGSGPLLWAVGAALRKMGAKIVSINEQASWLRLLSFGLGLYRVPSKWTQAGRLKWTLQGTPFRGGVWPLCVEGDDQVRAVVLTDGRRRWSERCDMLACGFGLVPNVELPLAMGCQMHDGFIKVDAWQITSVPEVYAAGELTGIGGVETALVEGEIAGLAASGREDATLSLIARRAVWHQFREALARTFALRKEVTQLSNDETVVCRCEDIRFGRLKEFGEWRDAKLQTRCGMGSCQGRICGPAAKLLFGWGMESVRLPVLPSRVASLRQNVAPLNS